MKRILSLILMLAMLISMIPSISFEADAASRVPVTNSNNVTGADIVAEARSWANTNATYWSASSPWPKCIAWRTGFTTDGQTSFDCCGFVSRVLNDLGFRGESIVANYSCILRDEYGKYFIDTTIAGLLNYGEDITDAVLKAKNGDYSGLKPGDLIGWTGDSNLGNHIIIYAGLNSAGKPTMVEFTGSGYKDRVITSSYQAAFQKGARLTGVEHADTPNIKWWLSDTVYGSEVSEYKAGNRYYFCYQLYDPLTGKLWDEVTNDNYTFTMTMYNTDGTILNSQTYSDDESYISVFYTEAGTYEYSLVMDGDWTYSSTRSFTVQENPLIVACLPQSFTLTLGEEESRTVYVWTSGYYNGNYTLYWGSYNDVVTCEWQPWENNYVPLVVTANRAGYAVVVITARDTETGAVIAQRELNITVNANTYTVEFNSGSGATFSTPSITVSQGDSMTIPTEIPQRFGKNFIGWYEGIYASGDPLLPGDTFTPNCSTTLYAHWQEAEQVYPLSTPVVTINQGGRGVYYKFVPDRSTSYRFAALDVDGDGGKDSVIKLYDASGNQLATDDDSGEGRMFDLNYQLTAGQTYYIYVYLFGSNVGTFYFGVMEGNYVQYNANGGTGAPAGFYHYVGSGSSTLSGTVPTREGYTFLGWSASSTATVATYAPGASFTANANTTLYAVWKSKTNTLNANSTNSAVISIGGEIMYYDFTPTITGKYVIFSTGTEDTKVFLYDANGNEIANNDDGAENYNFRLEYNMTAGTKYTFGVKYYNSSKTGTISFNFGNVYSISYDANGGTGAPAVQYVDYFTSLVLSSTVPTREGYTFTGWALRSSDTNGAFQPGDSLRFSSNATLYAVWQVNTYTISYNANGGSGAPNSQTKTHGQALTLSSAVPTRDGYTFLGWATSSTATSATYSAGDSFTTNANTILYAVWHAHTVVTDPAVAATCTTTGLTEGKHCSVCNAVLVAQNVIPKSGHTEVIDKAVPPTCNTTGLTEGRHCSVCDTVLVAQKIVPAPGHTEVIDKAVAPTCTDTGLTQGKHCSVCNAIFIVQNIVPALGHTEVIDKAVAPTCNITGLTEGKHCSVCNTILAVQTVVPALGHSFADGTCGVCGAADPDYVACEHEYEAEITYATTTAGGYTTYTCSKCGDSYQDNFTNPLPRNLRFASAYLSLESDLSVTFQVRSEVLADYENVRLVFTLGDTGHVVEMTEEEYFNGQSGRPSFKFTGVAPRHVNTTIYATLYGTIEGVEHIYTMEYSAAKYCYTTLRAAGTAAKLKTLIVDLLSYGAAHQLYGNTNLENLATNDLTDAEKALGTSTVPAMTSYMAVKYVTHAAPTARFNNAALYLEDAVTIRCKMTLNDGVDINNVTVQVTDDDGNEWIVLGEELTHDSGNVYYLNFKSLSAQQMRKIVYITICENGVAISHTLRYSIESYAATGYPTAAGTALGDVILAMIRYGDSAKAYFENK